MTSQTQPPRGAVRSAILLAVLLLPPLALQLAGPVPRLDADAVEYYSHLRSLYWDHDVDFTNEFDHFGVLSRWDKAQPTATGYRRTNFSVGPALLWMPFYAVGDFCAWIAGTREEGYSAWHVRSVALASLLYGVAGLWLVHRVIRDRVASAAAFWTTFLLFYGTFLFWYICYEPVVSHAASFFLAALAVSLWWPARDSLAARRAALLGVVLGLATCVRWQNAVLLWLPLVTLLVSCRRAPRRALAAVTALALGVFVGVAPQLVVFKSIFGQYFFLYPIQGRDYMRWDHPRWTETLFSSRHGLLFWTPLLWLAFLGLVALVRRERRLAGAVVVPVLLMTYVNACSADWWAGGSYSNRRFDSVLPLLALGLAASLEALREWTARSPGRVMVTAGIALSFWNALLMQQYRQGLVPRDDTVSFAQVAQNSAGLLREAVGSPVAWPANWAFAARHRLPAAQYDLAVGKYLFLRQNNLQGLIDLGVEDTADALLVEGWGVRRLCGTEVGRQIAAAEARLLAPLDRPEALDVIVRASGTGSLDLAVNGRGVVRIPLDLDLADRRLRVPDAYWRPDLNEMTLTPRASEPVCVTRIQFARAE